MQDQVGGFVEGVFTAVAEKEFFAREACDGMAQQVAYSGKRGDWRCVHGISVVETDKSGENGTRCHLSPDKANHNMITNKRYGKRSSAGFADMRVLYSIGYWCIRKRSMKRIIPLNSVPPFSQSAAGMEAGI